jgi:hypothetical protein
MVNAKIFFIRLRLVTAFVEYDGGYFPLIAICIRAYVAAANINAHDMELS